VGKAQDKSLQAIVITLVMTATVFLGACRQIEESDNPVSNALTAVGATPPYTQKGSSVRLDRIQFDDIPVMRGLRLSTLRNESFSYDSNGVRLGRFVYRGEEDLRRVQDHYVTTMPLEPYGWTVAPRRDDRPDSLFFTKGREHCEIAVVAARRTAQKKGLTVTIVVETN
jgi:hypothetical protein